MAACFVTNYIQGKSVKLFFFSCSRSTQAFLVTYGFACLRSSVVMLDTDCFEILSLVSLQQQCASLQLLEDIYL